MRNNHTTLRYPIVFAAFVPVAGCLGDESVDSQSQSVEGTVCSPDTQPSPTPGLDQFSVIAENRFDPYGILGPPVGQLLSAGEVSCPGNEPTGNPLAPCPVGSRAHTRGILLKARTTSPDPRGTGWTTIGADANLDPAGEGRLWGTFHLDLDIGGAWDGTFTEDRVAVPEGCGSLPCWRNQIELVGCGLGGEVDGMQIRAHEDMLFLRIAFLGHVEGVAFDPH